MSSLVFRLRGGGGSGTEGFADLSKCVSFPLSIIPL